MPIFSLYDQINNVTYNIHLSTALDAVTKLRQSRHILRHEVTGDALVKFAIPVYSFPRAVILNSQMTQRLTSINHQQAAVALRADDIDGP